MIWQTKAWGEMLVSSGQAEAIFNVSGIQIEKRRVAAGEYGLFALGVNSPLDSLLGSDFEKTPENMLLGSIFGKQENKLIELCKREKCLFIQVETLDYSISDSTSFHHKKGAKSKWKFIRGYYKKFITSFTAVIDLQKTEDQILTDMKPKGRYNIRLAERKGVKCEMVEKSDWHIQKFYDLMNETTSRDKFSGHSFEYFKTFLTTLENSELILAYYEGEIIAGGIFIFDSEISIYYYGASGNAHRNIMAPYLLQWSAIKIAKDRKSKLYDFLGVATPGISDDPLAGVTSFKKKLTSDMREISESYIFVNKKLKYHLIKLLKSLK